MKKKTIWIVLGCTILALLFLELAMLLLAQTQLKTPMMTIELGETISDRPADYISGMGFMVERSIVDLSNVNPRKVGRYYIPIYNSLSTHVCVLNIVDTKAPTFSQRRPTLYAKIDQTYRLKSFLKEVHDESGQVSIRTEDGSDTIRFSACGEEKIPIIATDCNGNEARATIKVIVDTAPVFDEFPDYYVAVGEEVDFSEQIDAYDQVDGDVTDQITMDTRFCNLNREGVGFVRYRVTDAYGLTSKATMKVHVYEPENLQELINTHEINRFDQRIIGAYNLYDSGIYPELTVKDTLSKLEPTLVRIRKDTARGYQFGSGFIAEITDDELIICTNKHVVKGYDNFDIYFHDGTKLKGQVIARAEGDKAENDVALVRVKREDITQELLDTLHTVHIDKGYWDSLSEQEKLPLGVRCIQENGSIWIERTGELLEKDIPLTGFEKEGKVTKINLTLQSGMSGSPIFDEDGYLIGMAVCVARVNGVTSYYAVTLRSITDHYREFTGHEMFYK